MTITEPATLVTDYLLATFTAILAVRLFGAARKRGSSAVWWWAVAFTATAAAGIGGGTVHGFQSMLPSLVTRALWVITLESLVVAAFAVIRGTLVASGMSDGAVRAASLVIGAAYGAYAIWVVSHPRFLFAIAAYGIALGVLVAFALYRWDKNPAAARWMLAGVAVSVIAALVQQSGFALHRHFNHNDLYHVVQALGVWLLYRGAIGNTSSGDWPID